MKVHELTAGDEELLRFSHYPGSGWAEIYVTERGQFMAMSDYGNFSHWWGSPGGAKPYDTRLMTVVRFLCDIEEDPHYFARKFAYGRSSKFQGKRTADAIRRDILDQRKEEQLSREDAREQWDRVPSEFENDLEFQFWCQRFDVPDPSEFSVYDTDYRDIDAFIERVLLPHFVPAAREWLATITREKNSIVLPPKPTTLQDFKFENEVLWDLVLNNWWQCVSEDTVCERRCIECHWVVGDGHPPNCEVGRRVEEELGKKPLQEKEKGATTDGC